MKLLVRNEIIEVLEEADSDWHKFILALYEAANHTEFSKVDFNMNNAKVIDVDDDDVIHYLNLLKIDTQDIIKVSTILADGFITIMRNYSAKLKELITGHKNATL
jgi:hypothetical protein